MRLHGWFRLAGFAALSLAIFVVHVLTVPLLDGLRLPGARWAAALIRAWGRGGARLLRMDVRVEGRAPEAPFLLVANHLSYVDVLVLGSQLGCVFVARGDVARWPLVGLLCRGGGTIFVDRDNKRDVRRAIARIDAALGRGRGVVLFPEGTSSAGESVLRFRPSLLASAAASRRPVWSAALSYETPPAVPPAATAVCWWGDMTFPDHLVRLFTLPGFRATLRFGEAVRATDRKVLAARLQEEVESRFRPTAAAGVPRAADSGRLAHLRPRPSGP